MLDVTSFTVIFSANLNLLRYIELKDDLKRTKAKVFTFPSVCVWVNELVMILETQLYALKHSNSVN